METSYRLDKSGSAVFDSTGTATVTIRNGGLNRWVVKNTSVSTSSVALTECRTYRGSAMPGNQVDSTNKGNGDSSDTVITIRIGEYITCQWTEGDTGAVATVVITGEDIATGRRAY